MDKNFGIAIEYKFYIDGWECIPGDALNIKLEDGSILNRAAFNNADEDYIEVSFYGNDMTIQIESIVDIEKAE